MAGCVPVKVSDHLLRSPRFFPTKTPDQVIDELDPENDQGFGQEEPYQNAHAIGCHVERVGRTMVGEPLEKFEDRAQADQEDRPAPVAVKDLPKPEHQSGVSGRVLGFVPAQKIRRFGRIRREAQPADHDDHEPADALPEVGKVKVFSHGKRFS